MNSKSSKKKAVKPLTVRRNVITAVILVVIASIVYKLISEGGRGGNDQTNNSIELDSSIQRGTLLALKNCQSCHMLPEPSLINKASWENVLPKMGLRLGIKYHDGLSYQSTDPLAAQEESRILPAKPALNESEWQDIINYYTVTAPDALPLTPKNTEQADISAFSALSPPASASKQRSMITYIKIDNSVKPARIFAFELYSNRLMLLNSKLELIDAIHVDGIIVDMVFHKGSILAVSMGPRMNLRDSEKLGKVFPLTINTAGKMKAGIPLFQNLARPLHVLPADLNNDSREDYIICEFGHLTGALTWMESTGNGKYTKHTIRDLPGSIKTISRPDKKTGRTALWVLFGQGEEGIFKFVNQGGGKLESKQVLRFPPIYGSSSFDMIDIDRDGFEDIVYTCGDNGDYSKVLKPYHGVYIYKNDGKDNFEKAYFYPLNGCYKAIPGDFSKTGQIDLAVISFFTNPNQSGESFVYLKNTGAFSFQPELLPQGKRFESLLTMDAGDADNDGKTDLLLGNAFPFPGIPVTSKMEPMFTILKNSSK